MTTKPLPSGANSAGIHGTRANAALKGAPVRKAAQIDHTFVSSDLRGGPELKAPHGVAVRDNRTKTRR